MKNMKKFLALLLAVLMVASITACGSNSNQSTDEVDEVFELKFAGSMPTDSPSSQAMESIKQYCEEKSNGRLKITTYPANQLGDSTLVFEDIMSGTVDMGCFFSNNSYDPRIAINSMPYMVTSAAEAKKVYSPGSHFFTAYSDILSGLGIHLLGIHGDGFVGLLYTKNPTGYNDASAKKDLMMRMSSTDSYRISLDAMGYNSVTIPFSDLYTSLQTGVCDGAIGLTPVSAESSVGDLVKYWVAQKIFIDPLDYIISEKTWEKLPEDLQQILQEAVTAATDAQFDNMDALDQEALDKMVATGCTVLEMTDAEFNAYVEKVRAEAWPEMAKLVGQDLIDEISLDIK